jgi:hypothetical protein
MSPRLNESLWRLDLPSGPWHTDSCSSEVSARRLIILGSLEVDLLAIKEALLRDSSHGLDGSLRGDEVKSELSGYAAWILFWGVDTS